MGRTAGRPVAGRRPRPLAPGLSRPLALSPGAPLRDTSSSTSCMKLATSGGSRWISLSLRPSLRRFSRRKKGCGARAERRGERGGLGLASLCLSPPRAYSSGALGGGARRRQVGGQGPSRAGSWGPRRPLLARWLPPFVAGREARPPARPLPASPWAARAAGWRRAAAPPGCGCSGRRRRARPAASSGAGPAPPRAGCSATAGCT